MVSDHFGTQTTTADSTMRAEYMAAYRASCEIMGCRNILEELDLRQQAPTLLYEDNQPCLRTATNNGAEQKRSKSFDLQWFTLKDRIIDNTIRMKYCKTARMIADIGTKLLPRQQFEFLRDMMNGYAIVAASKNHRKPLPAMAITHKQIVSVSVEGEAGSAGSEWRNRVRGPNTRKKGKPQRSSGNQWPMNSDDPNAMVTEKRPSMPGLDRRWCFFYGTKRDRDAWMVDRGNEIKRLKRIEHFKQATPVSYTHLTLPTT
mgnify:CR=1 FL=1